MILIDANLLIYAVNSDSPQHGRAKQFLERALASVEPVALPWTVVLAFIRVVTSTKALDRPMSPEAAMAFVNSWLEQPVVEVLTPGPGHWNVLRSLIEKCGTAGNLTSDAHLAAIAIEHGATIYSADHDFGRFSGIRHIDPLKL